MHVFWYGFCMILLLFAELWLQAAFGLEKKRKKWKSQQI